MPKYTEGLDDERSAGKATSQQELQQCLNALVTRYAAQNRQAQLDFDHFMNDGLTERVENVLWHMGTISILDRGAC